MPTILPKKILIVDEDLLSIATMAQTLLRNGYQVLHATDKERALKATRKERPDLIIYNFESKTMDAGEFQMSIQRARPSRQIPLLLITDMQESLNNEPGILDSGRHLNKPFTREQLTIAVQENLKRPQQQQR
jgi:response regulator RpfG family c-di-GMP phosphodiesterase